MLMAGILLLRQQPLRLMSILGCPVRPSCRTTKGDQHEGFGACESEQGLRSRPDAERTAAAGNGQVQRGARERGCDASGRGTGPELEGKAREIFRRTTDGDR